MVASPDASSTDRAPRALQTLDGAPRVERVTTKTPYPRGLAFVDDRLYVLCRGRARSRHGGVSASIDDQAGTIYVVDPAVSEPIVATDGSVAPVGAAVRNNGAVYARPTTPPFRLWNPASVPPESDVETDRPYCTLRYHAATDSFYICAFSGIDTLVTDDDRRAFSKNRTDGLLRYDRRTRSWHEVERHDPRAGASYPHDASAIPAGWLNGPDNCLPLGTSLYAVSKDNSLLVRYDVNAIIDDPNAGPPPGVPILGRRVDVRGHGPLELTGHSALAYDAGWLYVATRTSSTIVRVRLNSDLTPVWPLHAELVAQFEPWDAARQYSSNVTDMGFDEKGRLYVVSAFPARIHRFRPDPERVYDVRGNERVSEDESGAAPWLDLDALTRQGAVEPVKSENVLYHEGWLYITTGNGYGYQDGAHGTVYRARVDD